MARNRSVEQAAAAENTEGMELLKQFLGLFEQLPLKVTEGLLQVARDADEREVVQALSVTLNQQVRGLSSFVQESASHLSAQGRAELARVMQVSSGVSLVEAGYRLAANPVSQVARLSLSKIFHEIKKIIRTLIRIFSIPVPQWLDGLLTLIDEIVDMLMSAGILRLAPTLSQAHRDYLGELAQLERLERESAWRFATDEGEE